MYAIIETGGKQYWVVPGETLQIEKLPAEKGAEVTFKALWSASQEDPPAAGGKTPSTGAKGTVTAKVIRHLKGSKVLVFRKKTKKAYERSIGHRQELTEIEVKDIALA